MKTPEDEDDQKGRCFGNLDKRFLLWDDGGIERRHVAHTERRQRRSTVSDERRSEINSRRSKGRSDHRGGRRREEVFMEEEDKIKRDMDFVLFLGFMNLDHISYEYYMIDNIMSLYFIIDVDIISHFFIPLENNSLVSIFVVVFVV